MNFEDRTRHLQMQGYDGWLQLKEKGFHGMHVLEGNVSLLCENWGYIDFPARVILSTEIIEVPSEIKHTYLYPNKQTLFQTLFLSGLESLTGGRILINSSRFPSSEVQQINEMLKRADKECPVSLFWAPGVIEKGVLLWPTSGQRYSAKQTLRNYQHVFCEKPGLAFLSCDNFDEVQGSVDLDLEELDRLNLIYRKGTCGDLANGELVSRFLNSN